MSRILLIEDDHGAQLLFKNRLADLGHELLVAPTGAMGLMEARAGQFDLFLVDIGLGSGIDGYEVCRRLKATPAMHGVPVVLISGQVKSREELHRGYTAGCEAFLVKGDLILLEDVVRAMLRIKSLQDEHALQNRLLEDQNKRLNEERQRGADLEDALRETQNRVPLHAESFGGRPDGLLIVDLDGVVRWTDLGAGEILGKEIEGRHLANLAPHTGLEARVRDVHTEPLEGYRFDLKTPGSERVRSFVAAVVPLPPRRESKEQTLKAVILLDVKKRRLDSELRQAGDLGVPRSEMAPLLEAAKRVFHPSSLLGVSDSVVQLRKDVERLARSEDPVLIRGSVGVGKTLTARTLHFSGAHTGPFVPVNCAAVVPALLESELFGYVKGAGDDDALSDRLGALQQAQSGTLYLREIEKLPLELQHKLLDFLRSGEVTRRGSTVREAYRVRIIGSTTSDLEALVAQGAFDQELLQELNQNTLSLCDLHERTGDVAILARSFVHRFQLGRELELSTDALWALTLHTWPGNVRELETCLEAACAQSEGTIELVHLSQPVNDAYAQRIGLKTIPAVSPRSRSGENGSVSYAGLGPPRKPWHELVDEEEQPVSLEWYEKLALMRALYETSGDKIAAAKLLQVGKSTFYRKIKQHNL